MKRVIEVAPDNYSAYEVLERIYVAQRRFIEARAAFAPLAARHPRPATAHVLLGTTFDAEGKPDEARQQYEKALELDPKSGTAANSLAWLLAQKDDTLAEALDYATTAQRLLLRQPEVLDTLGWVHYRQGAARVAVSWFERAAQTGPDQPLYRCHLALALNRDGRNREARAALEQALASERPFKGDAEARRLLASLPADAPSAGTPKR